MSAAEQLETEVKIPDLLPQRIQLAEHQRNIYQCVVEPSVTRAHLLNDKFWQHVSLKFQPYTRIEVITDDGRFFCELLVISAGRNWAAVKELRYIELGGVDIKKEAAKRDEFEVKWCGPAVKWAVIRRSDNARIKDQLDTREQADGFLNSYVKTISK